MKSKLFCFIVLFTISNTLLANSFRVKNRQTLYYSNLDHFQNSFQITYNQSFDKYANDYYLARLSPSDYFIDIKNNYHSDFDFRFPSNSTSYSSDYTRSRCFTPLNLLYVTLKSVAIGSTLYFVFHEDNGGTWLQWTGITCAVAIPLQILYCKGRERIIY
jgi:hypothetical protein